MIIGLTGGIGSGKSTVLKIFEILGYKVFVSDEVAKELYLNEEIKPMIISLLGADAYINNKELNKKWISEQIFNDPAVLKKLNAIIHPAVNAKFKQFVESNKNTHVIIESALLFEAGINEQVDRTITVYAPDDIRIKRIMERDGLTKDAVIAKIANQMSQEEKASKSDHVIQNNEKESVLPQVLKIHEEILKENKAGI